MTLKLIRIRRLKQLQAERGASGPVELGKMIGRRGNQTSDLLRGRVPFGEKVARSIEEHAGLPLGWLDEAGHEGAGAPSGPAKQLPTTAIAIPVLRDADAGAHPDVFIPPLVVATQWLGRLPSITEPGNLRFFHVPDDGMQPTFSAGDVALVDVGVRQFNRDGVHLIQARGRLHVRRLRMRIDGSAEVSEDSPMARTVETLPSASLKIAGRVIWVWVGRST